LKRYVGKIETDKDFGFYWYIVNRGVKTHVAVCGCGFEPTKWLAKRAIRRWFKERRGKHLRNRI